MIVIFIILPIVTYLLGRELERDRWKYHNHWIDKNGVAKRYKNGNIENL